MGFFDFFRSSKKKQDSSARIDSVLISAIHFPWSTPIMGMMTMGNTRATRMPVR